MSTFYIQKRVKSFLKSRRTLKCKVSARILEISVSRQNTKVIKPIVLFRNFCLVYLILNSDYCFEGGRNFLFEKEVLY